MNEVLHVNKLELRFEPRPWAFAVERRAEIAEYFAKLRTEQPTFYNGRVLLLHRRGLADGVLSGAYFETDFASFIAWRDFGYPGEPVWNCFAQGVLRASDGHHLLGVMGDHTANAGKIYFPGGTPEPDDIFDGWVDMEHSVTREILEETGLARADFDLGEGWTCVLAGARIALLKQLRLREPADAARSRILRALAEEAQPELSDILVVRDANDLSDRMHDYVRAYFDALWSGTGRAT